jgi:drug/metabolite transporter (DMT)-like permease
MGATEWALLGILSVLWGGSFFFVEVMLDALDPYSVVFWRVGPAAAVLVVLVYATGHRMPGDWATWRAFVVMGVLNNVAPFTLIAWGQTEIESGLAAILNATTPLFTVALAHLVTADERLTMNRAIGVVAGLAGVAVLVGPGALAGIGAGVLGQAAILAAALCYACAGLYGRRLADLPAPVAAAGMVSASAVIALPIALAGGAPFAFDPDPATISAIAGLSLLSTACAYLIYFRVLAAAGATNLLLVTFLIPPSALVLGIAVLGERPTAGTLAGLALILVGLAAVDGRLFRVPRRAL